MLPVILQLYFSENIGRHAARLQSVSTARHRPMPPQFFSLCAFPKISIGMLLVSQNLTILRCRSLLVQYVPLCYTSLKKRAGMLFKSHPVYRHADQKSFRYVPAHARAPFLFVRIVHCVPSQDLGRHDGQNPKNIRTFALSPFPLFRANLTIPCPLRNCSGMMHKSPQTC